MKSKTILIPPPRNTDIPSRTHCVGASRDGVCSEAATCALHVRQMTTPAERPMLLPRVGSNPCHYRVEVAK
jgi:hypothetical protein